jgi:hypothetical protein
MSSNGLRRISIRGGKFHVISDGEEVTRDLGYMDVVIVNAAPVSRAYYGDAYPKISGNQCAVWTALKT